MGERFSVGPKENRNLPFSFALPYETPLSLGHGRVYLKTGLDVSGAIDPSDTDEIRVAPHPLQQAVLDAAASLGFRLYQVENEYDRFDRPRVSPADARSGAVEAMLARLIENHAR